MTRNAWIALIVAAVAFVLYTAWRQSQLAPRVPVTSDGFGGDYGGGGLLDSISRTVGKLTGIFNGLGGAGAPASNVAAADGSGGTGWV